MEEKEGWKERISTTWRLANARDMRKVKEKYEFTISLSLEHISWNASARRRRANFRLRIVCAQNQLYRLVSVALIIVNSLSFALRSM